MTVGIVLIRIIEVMFFTGLAGCAVVVLVSWVSIFKSGFSNKDEIKDDAILRDGGTPPQDRSYRFISERIISR